MTKQIKDSTCAMIEPKMSFSNFHISNTHDNTATGYKFYRCYFWCRKTCHINLIWFQFKIVLIPMLIINEHCHDNDKNLQHILSVFDGCEFKSLNNKETSQNWRVTKEQSKVYLICHISMIVFFILLIWKNCFNV